MRALLNRVLCGDLPSGDRFDAAARRALVEYQTEHDVNDGPPGQYGPRTMALLEADAEDGCG
ncbi:hypothetical protein [Kitasatospora sp. NPDC088346]|uniref:hypothetical protein n=1 Tax=Kitasatospora sp. NPDC088346 TaxID=3364073 RepID=UPI0037F979F0